MSEEVGYRPPLPEWAESLERAKAEIAAGRTVSMAPVLERLRASAGRLEYRRATAGQKA